MTSPNYSKLNSLPMPGDEKMDRNKVSYIPPETTTPLGLSLEDMSLSRLLGRLGDRLVDEIPRAIQRKHREDKGTGSETLGAILFAARERMEMTQRKLGECAGLHPTTVQKIETGLRGMSMVSFSKLERCLDDEFLDDILRYYRELETEVSGE